MVGVAREAIAVTGAPGAHIVHGGELKGQGVLVVVECEVGDIWRSDG